MREKPCKFAVDNSGEVWECSVHPKVYCTEQQFDRNPDGSVNIVMCGYEPPKEQAE